MALGLFSPLIGPPFILVLALSLYWKSFISDRWRHLSFFNVLHLSLPCGFHSVPYWWQWLLTYRMHHKCINVTSICIILLYHHHWSSSFLSVWFYRTCQCDCQCNVFLFKVYLNCAIVASVSGFHVLFCN